MTNFLDITPESLLYVPQSKYIDQPKSVCRNYHNRKLFFQVLLLGLFALIVMALPHPATAQLPDGPFDALVGAGQAVAEATAASVDDIWQEKLPLFMAILNQLSIAVAVISIISLGLELMQEYVDWNYFTWQRAVIPIAMLALIANMNLMADIALGLRNEFNDLSKNAYTTLDLINSIGEAGDADALPQVLSEMFRECQSTENEVYKACIEDAIEQANEVLDIEESNYPGAGWVDHFRKVVGEIAENVTDDGLNLWTIPDLVRDIGVAVIQPQLMYFFSFWSAAAQGAIQILLEITLFMTSILLPLAVARAISEGFAPLVSWLMKMLEFAMVKFFYTVIVGIASIIYLNAGGVGGGLWFPFTVGLFAPLMAFAMLTGAGMSVVNGIIGAVGSVAQVGLKVGKAF